MRTLSTLFFGSILLTGLLSGQRQVLAEQWKPLFDGKTTDVKNDPGSPKGHFALQMHSGNLMHIMFKGIEIKAGK